ncbi:GNAT family N-acetyltransferase [Kordia sp. TARA_039_SRF]|nr:GNAT family N-acetyltransferase [Kordia sp. TARA_039_SRF]
MEITREDFGNKGQFVIRKDNQEIGKMTYSWSGEDKFIIDHTEVNDNHEGNGYGKQMVMEAVKFARENNVKILPLCPFAKHIFDKNRDLEDVRF